MPNAVLRAIRAQPWAILPDYLAAIEQMALRALEHPAVVAIREDGHAERFPVSLAVMGQRLEGSRRATIRNGVASIPLFGPIFPRANMMTEYSGAASLDVAAHDLRVALASDAVSSILLVIDSPGGAVSGTPEFAGMVAAASKPVVAHVVGLGASAAYWIASQAQEIVADRAALVGSIGVVLTVGAQEEPDQQGVRYHDIVSSNAPNKRPDFGTEEGRAVIRAELDEIEKVFLADVAQGRKLSRQAVVEGFGRGGLRVGEAARKAGMVDRIDTLEGTLTRLARGRSLGNPAGRTAEHELPIETSAEPAPEIGTESEPEQESAPMPGPGGRRAAAERELELRRRRARS